MENKFLLEREKLKKAYEGIPSLNLIYHLSTTIIHQLSSFINI